MSMLFKIFSYDFQDSFFKIVIFLIFLLFPKYKLLKRNQSYKCTMIHPEKLYLKKTFNFLSNLNCLPAIFISKLVFVSKIKSFMESSISCYALQHDLIVRINQNLFSKFSYLSKAKSELLLCNYNTITFFFICYNILASFVFGGVKKNP